MDHYTDLRSEMVNVLMACGIDVEMQHHEVGTAGQAEIDIRFAPLLQTADNLMTSSTSSRTWPTRPARP